MRLLLDSHVVLWWLDDNSALGEMCRSSITSATEVYVSAVTPWELGIKQALGKLVLPDGFVAAVAATGFTALPISFNHATRAPLLPPHHRDPFDRMLIAQAELDSLSIVTADDTLGRYEVAVLDARR